MKAAKFLFGLVAVNLTLLLGASAQQYSLSTVNGAYVVVPYSPSLNTPTALTVECWFYRPVPANDWNAVVSADPNNNHSAWDLRFSAMDPVAEITLNPQTVTETELSNVPQPWPTTNQWYHYAMQYDGTNYFVWINGQIYFYTNCTAQIATLPNQPIYIGRQGANFFNFLGNIAEVRISNIGRYYHPFTPQSRFVADSHTVALYHFDEGQGTTAWSTNVPIPTGPQITQDLTNFYAVYDQSTTIGVTANSPTPLTYQWYFLPANNGGQAGAYAQTIAEFVYGAVVTNGGFGYGNIPSVSFMGGGGSGAAGYVTTSNGVVVDITVTNAGYGYTNAPSVEIAPPNGQLFGQTNDTLTINNADADSIGNYYVVVSNSGGGSVTSSVVNLTLLYPPTIVDQPQSTVVYAHTTAAFSVSASGTAPLNYQWTMSGTNLPGANADTLIVSNVTPNQLGTYAVTVTNEFGSVTSSNAELLMYPFIASPFTGLDTYWGQTNTMGVGAWGSGTLTYQWYQNGVALLGATNATLTFPDIQFTNAGSYYVVVGSTLGSVTNATYQVIVNPANIAIALFPAVVIQGTVGFTYTIESTTNLSNPNAWIVETNLTLTQPIEDWNDNSADVRAGPRKFYQVLPGQ